MKKLLGIGLLAVVLQGCATPNEVAQSRFDAARQERLAELERERGNEAMARIYEDSADRNRSVSSFWLILLENIFK